MDSNLQMGEMQRIVHIMGKDARWKKMTVQDIQPQADWIFSSHFPSEVGVGNGTGALERTVVDNDEIRDLMSRINSGANSSLANEFKWKDNGMEDLKIKARPELPPNASVKGQGRIM